MSGPISVIGFVSSVLGVVDIVACTIISLRELQLRWKAASLTISLLLGQLTVLKAALTWISDWISTSLAGIAQHYQLVVYLEASLESCKILISHIDQRLSRLKLDDSSNLTIEGKIKTVLEDGALKDLYSHISNQANAFNPQLTVLSWLLL
ncbi:MAG: hypothetical protein MMC33_003775 [Icmadophila ericetorum]|nr:hypothetical protein [Icmadophila ericetorum]